jgi:hypothetical protein
MKSNLKFRLAAMIGVSCVIGALITTGVAVFYLVRNNSQPWVSPAVVLVCVGIGLLFEPMARRVAERKNLDPRKYSSPGATAFIRALLAEPAAPGMRAVRCPRCRADQDIPRAHSTFGCRRCGLISSAPRVKGRAYAG